ncbi:MAG: DEAD/DEAH box helicase [Treponema sp.]|jgi:ATP-dependent RNA helicase DeaD|nr:DEAD/DEAH box helicase [Treponema sp.]
MTTDNHPFSSFGLSEAMLEALTRKGFTAPSSIQTIALPRLLADQGHLIVKARTGTGKTAAFGIPLVEHLTQAGLGPGRAPRALILTPTRELALQVSKEIASFISGSYPRISAVYGGASIRNQIIDLKRGTEIVVGTPGRIMDLMERKVLDLSAINWFILDEADEMLDMGFFEDVETILKAVKPERRVALFSATMPEAILRIVREYIGDVEILEDIATEDEKPAVDQYYLIVKKEDRPEVLRRIIDGAESFYGLVFCATKAGADELARRLIEGGYTAEAIHGDLSQEARERTLRRFRSRLTTILVATDVAARGLDIERLTHVINWDLPGDRETYVHRIGRTGRAGRRGKAISLALPADRGRMAQLSRSMERTLGSQIQWMKVPQVKKVMKAVRNRIFDAVVASFPETLPETNPLSEDQPANHQAVTGQTDTGQAAGDQTADSQADTGRPAEDQTADHQAVTDQAAGNQDEDGQTATGQIPGPAFNQVSPLLARLSQDLIERLGSEGAVEALINLSYGDLLDPSRYGPVMEFQEVPPHDEGRNRLRGRGGSLHRAKEGRDFWQEHRPERRKAGYMERGGGRSDAPGKVRESFVAGGQTRVYVGLGRRHGASARDVAGLLMRAGGIPGHQVDAIEMKDYCAFATLPTEAARRACAFSRHTPEDPTIKPASPQRNL